MSPESPRGPVPPTEPGEPEDGTGRAAAESAEEVAGELARMASRLPERLDAGPEDVERGLAQLVLSLVEFLRQVLEKQAVRRVEAGSLNEEEVERLGLTLLRLRERMDEIKAAFDLDDEDLSLGLDDAAQAHGVGPRGGSAPGPVRGGGGGYGGEKGSP